MITKVKAIKGKTPEELAENINKFNKKRVATQIMETREYWVGFVYFEDDGLIENEKKKQTSKDEPASKKQINKLKELNIEFKNNITKKEAWKIINEKLKRLITK